MARRLQSKSKLIFAMADQGVSSLCNLGVNLAVASSSSAETYGALGLVLSLYLLEFGVVYGAVVEPFSVSPDVDSTRVTRHAVAATVVLSVVLATATLAAAPLASGDLAMFLVAAAIATPGLLVQVAARGLLIARGRTRITMLSNGVWGVVQIGGSIVAWQLDSSLGLYVAWAAGAWVAGAFCLWQLGTGVVVRGSRDWFRGRLRLAASWTGDQLAQGGLAQVMVFTLGAVAGLSAVAAYRGAIQLTGPATVLVAGLRLAVLPGAARRARAADGSLQRSVSQLSLGFPLLMLVVIGPFLLIPEAFGERLLGETWGDARAVLPWILLMRMASSVTAALSIGMRALHEYRETMRLRVLGGVATIVICTAAGALHGALGAAMAMAAVSVLLIPLWRRALSQEIRFNHARASG